MVFECKSLRAQGDVVTVDLKNGSSTIRLILSKEESRQYFVGKSYALTLSEAEAPAVENKK